MQRHISNQNARRLFIAKHGLVREPGRMLGKQGLAEAIDELGFVQVDSINVVERAHHHILFSRSQTYRKHHLSALIEKDRVLFENWTHDASIIPTAFFPYWKHRFEHEKQRLRERWKDHFGKEGFDDDLDMVRERVARDGPVMARDFDGDKPNTGWWDWHPAKAALEFLWRTGELSITRRDGFQKVYDLAERVIPDEFRLTDVSREEFVDWACRSALERLGMASRGEIVAFWNLLTPQDADEWIAQNRKSLLAVNPETMNGAKGAASYMLAEHEHLLDDIPEPPGRVRILSPFDPLLRNRKRTERLFGFFYRIEVFVPEAKRRYGYYVFPVMRGDRIVGRIDMKADRNDDALAVRAFWREPGIRSSKALQKDIEAELDRIRRFAGVAKSTFEAGWFCADHPDP
ncbi:MAG: YcaQ family DNA glycosylase [Rhizobiaceae bacterium]|nr:YcaQ family DNA glycosylase [Rhizobiaceae bacterium]